MDKSKFIIDYLLRARERVLLSTLEKIIKYMFLLIILYGLNLQQEQNKIKHRRSKKIHQKKNCVHVDTMYIYSFIFITQWMDQ